MRRLLSLVVVLAACSPQGDPPLAIVANSDLAVGPQRMLLGLRAAADGAPLEEPERTVTVELFAPNGEPVDTVTADFLWLVEGVRGVYSTSYTFPEAGIWNLRLMPSDLPATEMTPFNVFPDALTPDAGDPAPLSETLTADDAPLQLLSSDPNPDPAFYELSVAEAVSSGSPSVLVFATPAFCQTATCGPTLDSVKSVRGEYPEIHFVHVEVFDLSRTPELVPIPAVIDDWRLPSEPWVFIVDAAGVVAARFEGVVTASEIRAALDRLR
ncbi:MAG: hypothetical protein ACE5MI_07370 [Acidimicrobiia bacterium]